jgi:hypothetical protein
MIHNRQRSGRLRDKQVETRHKSPRFAVTPGLTRPQWVFSTHEDNLETPEKHGDLTTRSDLPESVYAFPKQQKEPLTDAAHVRNALARFDQVGDVSDSDRDLAFANILAAAKHYHVDVDESDWHDLGKRPHTKNPAK